MRAPEEDVPVPASVRLGAVVPPEDPEDWTRPLTWVAALGMLAPAALAAGWFLLAAPTTAGRAPMTAALAATLAAAAATTGATQLGRGRAFAATLGAGLFGALGVVVLAAATADRDAGGAAPTIGHAVVAVAAGLAGVGVAATLAAAVAGIPSRLARGAIAAGAGGIIALLAIAALPD